MGSMASGVDDSDPVVAAAIAMMTGAKNLLATARRRANPLPIQRPNRMSAHNKLSTPQKRFFSTKKKRERKPLKKASQSEVPVIRNILSHQELLINEGQYDHDYIPPPPPSQYHPLSSKSMPIRRGEAFLSSICDALKYS